MFGLDCKGTKSQRLPRGKKLIFNNYVLKGNTEYENNRFGNSLIYYRKATFMKVKNHSS